MVLLAFVAATHPEALALTMSGALGLGLFSAPDSPQFQVAVTHIACAPTTCCCWLQSFIKSVSVLNLALEALPQVSAVRCALFAVPHAH